MISSNIEYYTWLLPQFVFAWQKWNPGKGMGFLAMGESELLTSIPISCTDSSDVEFNS